MGNAADDSQMVGAAVTVWVHVEEEGGPVVPTKSPLGWVPTPVSTHSCRERETVLAKVARMLASAKDILSHIWNQQAKVEEIPT